MAVELLAAAETARRRSQALTYEGAGCTRTTAPAEYAFFARTRRLPAGTGFDTAAAALMSWQVQARAGLRVVASSAQVVDDAVCIMRLGRAPIALSIPCRVVYTIDETDERGFAYGTLPGHPESGEEAFVLHRRPDGGLDFTITAFSRRATVLAKMGGPLTRALQRTMTSRYLRALDE